MRLLVHGLRYLVRHGRLTLVDCKGRSSLIGDGEGPSVVMRLKDRAVERRLLLNPELAVGEAYMDGRLEMVEGSVADLLAILMGNLGRGHVGPFMRLNAALRFLGRRIAQFNGRLGARQHVAHHYDLSSGLYDLFLDHERQYSCAVFETDGDTIDQAQRNKLARLAAKLALSPGDRVLDIGSGWGGLALWLAGRHGAEVTGVTLSAEQLAWAEAEAARRGLSRNAGFRLQDYRDVEGSFDRIVSVGMLEHVGVGNYGAFFQTIARLLDERGAAVIHAIGRSDGPGATNPWIARYIFPGGYTPALSELLPAIERAGLWVTDIEILRLHYAKTLAAWRARFMARRLEALQLYDERFCRMWEFYLAAAEMGFRYQGLMVFQIQLSRRVDALPLTRDYMTPAPPRARAAAA
ncbi:MAG: cyclopropane-fatty-acyl-phospholipid synthase family protein [Micropepsaceae bacterium]